MKLKKYMKPHIFGVLLLALLILLWLFLFPHGVADNGDFFRLIHNRGLSHLDGTNADKFFNYFTNKYRISNWYIDNKVPFISTQSIIIALSVGLNKIFDSKFYDIRFIGFLYAGVYLIAAKIILKRIETGTIAVFSKYSNAKKRLLSWIFCGLFVLIFGDFAYLLYFNSFYGEALTYTALLMLIACLIKILEKEAPKTLWLVLYTIAGVTLVGAKQQNAPVAILIAAFTLRLMTLYREKFWRVFAAVSALAVISCAVITYAAISDEIAYINAYNSMTLGVMRYADKEDKITDLNVSPQLAILKDTTAFDRYPVALINSPLLYGMLYDRVSITKIGLYYVKNYFPLMHQLQAGTSQSFTIKPDMVGNYLKTSGKPPLAKTYLFSGYSFIKKHIIPHSIGWFLIFYIIFYAVGGYLYYRFYKQRFKAGLLAVEFSVIVGLTGLMQLLIAVLGAGDADLEKHLFLTNVTFDLMFLTLIYLAVYWAGHLLHRRKILKLKKQDRTGQEQSYQNQEA